MTPVSSHATESDGIADLNIQMQKTSFTADVFDKLLARAWIEV